jgi:pimeloyl-[acyl-carrier protein] methyl ester esterase
MSLHVETRGAGRDVVLLHGWGLHGGVWSGVLPALAEHYRVHCVDLPGFGRSRAAWRAGSDLGALAEQLLAAVPQPAVWVGWSLGGLLALAAAQRAAHAVSALVLIGSTPRFVQADDWRCAMPGATLQQFADELARDYRTTLMRFLSLQFGSGEAERAALRALRAQLLAHGEPAPEALRAGLTLLATSDVRGMLPMLDVPALVLHGQRDRLAPVAAGEYLAAHLPRAHWVAIAGAGHAPFLSHAGDSLAAIHAFLQEQHEPARRVDAR